MDKKASRNQICSSNFVTLITGSNGPVAIVKADNYVDMVKQADMAVLRLKKIHGVTALSPKFIKYPDEYRLDIDQTVFDWERLKIN